MENKMLTAPGEELTEEIRKGVEDSKKDGFKYFKSPTEMFSALDELDKELDTVKAYCDEVKAKAETEAYSKIKSFSDLILGVKDLVSNSKSNFSAEYQAKIDDWLKSFDENPTSDGFSESLKQLKFALTDGDWANSKAYEELHLGISKMLDEYNGVTGELFFFSSVPVEKVIEPDLKLTELRDDAVFYLADNGFHKASESSYVKDLQGYEVVVNFGGDKADVIVSGSKSYQATVSLDRIPMEVSRWLRQPETYSRRYPTVEQKPTEPEIKSYSRSYAQTTTSVEPKAMSYTSRIKGMIGL